MERANELAMLINASNEWNFELLAELCELAGLSKEWEEADGETFESVAYRAAKILEIEI